MMTNEMYVSNCYLLGKSNNHSKNHAPSLYVSECLITESGNMKQSIRGVLCSFGKYMANISSYMSNKVCVDYCYHWNYFEWVSLR